MFQFATIAMYTAHLRAPSGAVGVKPKKKHKVKKISLEGKQSGKWKQSDD